MLFDNHVHMQKFSKDFWRTFSANDKYDTWYDWNLNTVQSEPHEIKFNDVQTHEPGYVIDRVVKYVSKNTRAKSTIGNAGVITPGVNRVKWVYDNIEYKLEAEQNHVIIPTNYDDTANRAWIELDYLFWSDEVNRFDAKDALVEITYDFSGLARQAEQAFVRYVGGVSGGRHISEWIGYLIKPNNGKWNLDIKYTHKLTTKVGFVYQGVLNIRILHYVASVYLEFNPWLSSDHHPSNQGNLAVITRSGSAGDRVDDEETT